MNKNKTSNKLLFLLIGLLSLISLDLFGQKKKLFFSVEYTLNRSIMIGSTFKLSHLGIVRLAYETRNKLTPTIGLGFMNTGGITKFDYNQFPQISEVIVTKNNNFLVIPVGFKFNLASIFIMPEIGVGLNLSQKIKTITVLADGNEKVKMEDFPARLRKTSIPFYLTIGTEFKINKLTLQTGIKAYTGLNKLKKSLRSRYFGIGFSLGLKF